MAKATEIHNLSWIQTLRRNKMGGKEQNCSSNQLLTGFPRTRSHPHSTPWLNDREKHCTDHESPSWRKDPETEKQKHYSSHGKHIFEIIKVLRQYPTMSERTELTDTGPLCPGNLYRCLHVSASQIMISLFMSPVAYKMQQHSCVIYFQLTNRGR